MFSVITSGPQVFKTSSAYVLYNRPSCALPVSQAWNLGRTTSAWLHQRQRALYPLTCQQRRQMNSPSNINGIKEHPHWWWIVQSSSANMQKIKTGTNVTTAAEEAFVERVNCPDTHVPCCISLCVGCHPMCCFNVFSYYGCWGLASLHWWETVPFKTRVKDTALVGCKSLLWKVICPSTITFISHQM